MTVAKMFSADLKGSQFSRFRGEPESLPVVAEHTNTTAAVEDQAVAIASFFPASDGQFMNASPAPSTPRPYCGIPVASIFVSTD
jgi:hypothetical protein